MDFPPLSLHTLLTESLSLPGKSLCTGWHKTRADDLDLDINSVVAWRFVQSCIVAGQKQNLYMTCGKSLDARYNQG